MLEPAVDHDMEEGEEEVVEVVEDVIKAHAIDPA